MHVSLASCVLVWCNVILPDSSVTYCADAEVPVRGSGEVVTVAIKGGKSVSDDLME